MGAKKNLNWFISDNALCCGYTHANFKMNAHIYTVHEYKKDMYTEES